MAGGAATDGRDGGGTVDAAHSDPYEAACRHCDATPCDPYCHAAPGLYGHAAAYGSTFSFTVPYIETAYGYACWHPHTVRMSADAARPAEAGRPPRRGASRG